LLGLAARQAGNHVVAADFITRAIKASPKPSAFMYFNRGLAWQAQGQRQQAIADYRQAAALKPDLTEAHNNMGNLLYREGLLEDAVAAYRQAMAIDPAFAAARTNILLILQYMAGISAEELFAEHRRFAEFCEAPLKARWQAHGNSRDPHKRLKIGYVSADFRDHAVAYFIEPIMAAHDREHVEVFCYYNHFVVDATTERIKALADHWRPCLKLSDDALAGQIRQDGIDILVDLSGHTLLNRLLTFARKPAPVQLTWLGYPDTTGLEAMDYRLTDARLDPPGLTERWHTETLLRLPASAVFKPSPASPPGQRPACPGIRPAHAGLPE
jgi:predicted O-linked N-acetylglucosamine transferase (SPINDLY family)